MSEIREDPLTEFFDSHSDIDAPSEGGSYDVRWVYGKIGAQDRQEMLAELRRLPKLTDGPGHGTNPRAMPATS